MRKLPSGRFQASYLGADGKRYTAPKTFDAKIDAQQWLFDRRRELDGDIWQPPAVKARRGEAFGDYAASWIAHRRVNGRPIRPRTREEYERLLAGPLAPFKDTPLDKVNLDDVKAWHATETDKGKVTQTSRAYALLKAVFAEAVDRGDVDKNPAGVKGGASSKTGRKVVLPTADELAALHAAMVPQYRALVTVASSGALRFGEATELRRHDITKRPDGSATIRVERAVVHTRDGAIVGLPKSAAGVRSVTLSPQASAELFDHLKTHVGKAKDALLFPAANGEHLAQWLFAPHWRAARLTAGRPDLGFHALRHYALTRFAQIPGANLIAVMNRAGHSTVSAAMNYQHAAADLDAELAGRMS
jgi:integrase